MNRTHKASDYPFLFWHVQYPKEVYNTFSDAPGKMKRKITKVFGSIRLGVKPSSYRNPASNQQTELRNQWQFSPTDRPNYCLGRSICDYESHINIHTVPYSFLKETMENSKNFGARNIKDKNSPITKSTVQMSDSAGYYCLLRDTHSAKGTGGNCTKISEAWLKEVKCCNNSDFLRLTMSLRIGVSGKTGVEHRPQYLTAQEGDSVTINCSYSRGMTTLHWLQQNPGGGIVSLFILSLETKKKGRVRATVNTEELHSSLYITAAQPRDSATYLCAVGTQCSTVIRSPYPNSAVQTSFPLILVFLN
ncbi:hypothetical protein GH733_004125, partial [Mirounga leonina]